MPVRSDTAVQFPAAWNSAKGTSWKPQTPSSTTQHNPHPKKPQTPSSTTQDNPPPKNSPPYSAQPPQSNLAGAFENAVDGEVAFEDEIAGVLDLVDGVEAVQIHRAPLPLGELRTQ